MTAVLTTRGRDPHVVGTISPTGCGADPCRRTRDETGSHDRIRRDGGAGAPGAPPRWRLAQGGAPPLAATWLATLVLGVSLWSGRVPFAVGSAVSALALAAVRDHRRLRAAAWTAVAVLASPVSGAFIAVGLAGVLAAR